MSELFEALMVISFGISWPMAIVKSYTARTATGKSVVFLSFILAGYIFGIIFKLTSGNITYVFAFYVLNLVMVFIDFLLYFKNKHLDAVRTR